jgi:hypothetical protein
MRISGHERNPCELPPFRTITRTGECLHQLQRVPLPKHEPL